MSIRHCGGIILGILLALFAVHGGAATVPYAYGALSSVHTQGPGFKSITTLGGVSINGPLGNAQASTGTAPAPSVSADARSIAGPTAVLSAETAATGSLGYSFVVVGPPASTVPLWLTASGFVSRSGASSGDGGLHDAAQAYLKVTPQYFPSVVAIEICTGNGYNPTVPGTQCASGTSDGFSIAAQKINVPANTVIFVDMWAGAKAVRDGEASAWVDPYFVIDPSFASAKLYSLVFSPGIIQLQPAAAEWVQKAYVAYYGRPADPAGLAWWADRLVAEGGDLASIIAAFGTSDEFARRYGGKSFEELIEALYQQALGRVPDPAGRLWYLGQLILKHTTPQTITLDLLGGATGQDALTVAHRLAVASYYTDAVAAGCSYGPPGEEEATGVASLAAVTSDPATVVAAKAAIDSRCGR